MYKIFAVLIIMLMPLVVKAEIVKNKDGVWVEIPDHPKKVKEHVEPTVKDENQEPWDSGLSYTGRLSVFDHLVHRHGNAAECLGGLIAARQRMVGETYVKDCGRLGKFAFECNTTKGKTIKWYCTSDGDLYCDDGL